MHDETPQAIPFRTLDPPSRMLKGILALLVLIGAATLFLAGGGEDPGRIWRGLLFNWLFWSSTALGMVLFAMALSMSNARWAWSIRRFALGGAAFLPISFILLIVVFFGSEHYFHHWLHVEGDPVLDAKAAWLNLPGMITRDLIAVAILYGLCLAFLYFSVRPDIHGAGGDRHRALYDRITRGWRGAPEEAARSRTLLNRLAPISAILYALIWGMIAVDLAMSLSPHWFSTMFPVAFIWTGFHGGLAATAIAVVLFRKRARIGDFVTTSQFHDLGKLLFAFCVFWMYLNWAQYIVIWYGLLPWEQAWMIDRFSQPFAAITEAAVLMIFVIPFFGLLTRPPKKIPAILAMFSVIVLAGHWLERFLLVVPSVYEGEALPLGLPEIGIALGFFGLFALSYLWYARTFPLLPSPVTLAAEEPAFIQVPVATTRT
ncbi:MAG TPA: hypothetical protein VFI91_01475 [Longimicrobiaceae bacterium]|nr:hypothetical protein [Longimicrobiaceae bacterium]